MLSSCLSILAPTAAAVFFSLTDPACAQVAGHSSSGPTQSITLTGTATGLTVPAVTAGGSRLGDRRLAAATTIESIAYEPVPPQDGAE
jgi:hypothetical protein